MSEPVYVLGISAFYHDSAAALTCDGRIVAAAQEERFTRKKHDPRFPVNAINYCLEAGRIDASALASVAFYDNPALSLDRILRTLAEAGKDGLASWLRSAPSWLTGNLFVEKLVREELKADVPVLFCEHHFSHAASAFYPSPFSDAAVLTIDGVGEWATTTLGAGRGSDLEILQEIHFPHSLGLLYSAFTQFCGFKVNSGEYKLMGLAPYGKPVFADVIFDRLIDLKDDGSFRINMEYFGYIHSQSMTGDRFAELFGGPARKPESRITRREMDLAASIQAVTEEVVLRICRHLRALTGLSKLCLAGGVALNCVANGKVLREKVFDDLWIQPAAGDAGGSVGAALMATHAYHGVPRPEPDGKNDSQHGSYLGPVYSNAEVKAYLNHNQYKYHEVGEDERAKTLAAALADGKVIGYMVGRMEFGPRSLGARSILGDARREDTQSRMNLQIKFRESFRPFAPSVLRERVADYFEMDCDSPYMLLVAPVKSELLKATAPFEGDDMIAIVNQARSTIPAVTHVDNSARVQTVHAETKPDFHQLLKEFDALTGVGVLVNTSFNVRGEPIVCTPRDAYTCFMRTNIDILVLENCLLYKSEQPAWADAEDWRSQHELD
jgi:carbamoyltransferase